MEKNNEIEKDLKKLTKISEDILNVLKFFERIFLICLIAYLLSRFTGLPW